MRRDRDDGPAAVAPATVAIVNGSVLTTAARSSRQWRLRAWPGDPTVAHLIILDQVELPTADAVDAAIDRARRSGARAVRTSALYPQLAEMFAARGFEPIDRLVLLRRELGPPPAHGFEPVDRLELLRRTLGGPPDIRPDTPVVQPMRRWHLAASVVVDREAFGPMWANDRPGLREIRRATPHHRAGVVTVGRRVAGFAISGAALDRGYLQRLSVAADQRRRGIATKLVADALDWMYGRGLTAALVNTGVHNAAALALYDKFRFVALDDELVIAERRFRR